RSRTLAQTDARLIARKLALARAVKVTLGFTLFGWLGGLGAWGLVARTGQAVHGDVGLVIVLGTGSALLGAVSFFVLAAVGPVPLEDFFVPYKDWGKAGRKA